MFKPVAMGWHGVANATPGLQDTNSLSPLGNLLQFYIVALYLRIRRDPLNC